VRRTITQSGLDDLLRGILQRGTRLVAPVRKDHGVVFEAVPSGDDIEREYGNTNVSPKEIFFPRCEPILEFQQEVDGPRLEGVQPDAPETVLFGVRPCDAAGMAILEAVFDWDCRDEFFLQRREATTLVALACTDPAETCFCTATGGGPASTDGSDLLISPTDGDVLLAEASTEKGEKLLEDFSHLFGDAEGVTKRVPEMPDREDLTEIGPALRGAFGREGWDEIGRGCLGCGACSHSCPTCHCFDIIDEGDLEGGRRLKIWDTCALKTFTLHASGHNPRPSQQARYRQRVLHKFSYFPERFGRVMCVGCGRCLVHCPVGQDIYESALRLKDG
jgi:ferredoxin